MRAPAVPHDVLAVRGDAFSRRHVGLLDMVGLVESENMAGAAREGDFGVRVEVVDFVVVDAVEHGDEFEGGGELGVEEAAPVVGPG